MRPTVIIFVLSSHLGTIFGSSTDEEKRADLKNGEGSSLTYNRPSDLVFPTSSLPDDCTCVNYYLCNDNKTLSRERDTVIDIAGTVSQGCSHFLKRCCANEHILPENTPVPIKLRPGLSETNSCGNRVLNGIDIRLEILDDDDLEAQYGEFPWVVAVIQNDTSQQGKYQCGGSLIHPQVVLTASHCVAGKENLMIRAGEWDTQTDNEILPTQDCKVSEVIVHEQFNNRLLSNDIALLILESTVNMTLENVGLICLPELNEVMDGRDCITNGWGKDLYGKEGKYSVILNRVDLPVVAQDQCLQTLRKTRLGQRFELHESFICAGGQSRRDTCKGDGGSPLVCPSLNNRDVYVQAGIVSWGIECGTDIPGVFVNVPYFVDWIKNRTQARQIILG